MNPLPLPDDEARADDGLPAYASERTRRLNWSGDYLEYAASLEADRRESQADYYGDDD